MASENKIDPVSTPSAFALIIGIGKYKDPRIPVLNFTPADANSFYNLLLNDQHAGFSSENVKLLMNEDATFFKIKNAISGWLFQNATSESTVVVYFAGHGGQESDKTGDERDGISKYLLPWDCDRDDLFSSALSNLEFNRLLKAIKAKRVVIFMDACYAGGVTSAGSRDVGVVEDFNQKLGQGEGRVIIAAARPNQRSWEDENLGHGIFTYHLLEALQGKADFDNDGYVSVWEVYKYLEQKVPDSVRQIAKSIQEPLLCGDISKDIYLTVNSERAQQKQLEILKHLEEQKTALREKKARLFQMYSDHEMKNDIFHDALNLLDKNPDDCTERQKILLRNLDALLNNGSLELYLVNREALLATPEKPEPQKSSRDLGSQKVRFCTNCGAPLQVNQIFCSQCRNRVAT